MSVPRYSEINIIVAFSDALYGQREFLFDELVVLLQSAVLLYDLA